MYGFSFDFLIRESIDIIVVFFWKVTVLVVRRWKVKMEIEVGWFCKIDGGKKMEVSL